MKKKEIKIAKTFIKFAKVAEEYNSGSISMEEVYSIIDDIPAKNLLRFLEAFNEIDIFMDSVDEDIENYESIGLTMSEIDRALSIPSILFSERVKAKITDEINENVDLNKMLFDKNPEDLMENSVVNHIIDNTSKALKEETDKDILSEDSDVSEQTSTTSNKKSRSSAGKMDRNSDEYKEFLENVVKGYLSVKQVANVTGWSITTIRRDTAKVL